MKATTPAVYTAFMATPLWETDDLGFRVITDPVTNERVDVMTRRDYDEMIDGEALRRAENGYVTYLETRDDDYYRWCDQVEYALGRIN